MNPENVSNCQRCQIPLDRGYSTRYVNNECKEVICFKCDNSELFDEYFSTKTITTHLMLNNSMELFNILTASRDPVRIDTQNTKALMRLQARLDIQIATNNIQQKVKEFEKEFGLMVYKKLFLTLR